MKSNMFDFYSIMSIIKNRGGCSLDELSEITNLPLELLSKNLKVIYENNELLYEFKELQLDLEDYETDIDSGRLIIEDNIDSDEVMISLNTKEKNMLMTILSHNDKNKLMGIETKQIYNINLNRYIKYQLIQISTAINENKVLRVMYEGRDKQTREMFIEPLGIIFYEFENLFYILGQYEGKITIYKLDRISKIHGEKRTFQRIPSFSMDKFLENIWGMEQGKEVWVKVKFLKEANVEYKVKRDIEFRKNKVIEDYENYFIYEDTIIGINSFKSWLRGYGSSAIVLEPQELRIEIIESAKKLLNYYRKVR